MGQLVTSAKSSAEDAWAKAVASVKLGVAGAASQAADKLDDFQRSNIGHTLQALPPEGIAVAGVKAGLLAVSKAAGGQTTVIGKLGNLTEIAAGERTLLDRLPNLGSPKANWAQNSSVLRQEMSLGRPIRDATVDASGRLINNTGFIRAERNLLETHGWTFDTATTFWTPPSAP